MTLFRSFAIRAAVLCTVFAAMPTAAQRLGEGGGATISIWRVLAALLLCLGLAAAAAVALRYRLRGEIPWFGARLLDRPARRLKLVESLRLSHQVDLCLVAVDGETMLLVVTGNGVSRLETSSTPKQAAPDE